MNVLIIPAWYPNGEDKLMGIYHKEFCEALGARDNIKVNMLFIDRQRITSLLKYPFMSKWEIDKQNNYDVYIRKMIDIGIISMDLQLKKYVKVLDKAYQKYLKYNEKPDVIHAQVTIPSGYAAAVLGKKYNIPVVVTEHSSYFKRFFQDEVYKKYGEYTLENSYFTTVSNYMAKDIKCDVIPNLVDTEYFNGKRAKIKDLKLITVSALRKGKRIDDIIEALKIINEKYQIKATLTIIGDGFYEDKYKNRCLELKMEDKVNFLGRLNKEEIRKELLRHNVFVIASEKETFCIPGVEALASGMPVVATKCLGPEEYIDNKCGKLVDVGNIEEMAQKIVDVYQNIDKYDEEVLRKVASKYSALNVTNKAIDIYQKLILNKK